MSVLFDAQVRFFWGTVEMRSTVFNILAQRIHLHAAGSCMPNKKPLSCCGGVFADGMHSLVTLIFIAC